MKQFGLILLMTALVIVGCKKPVNQINDSDVKVEDLIISDNFEWNTSQIVSLSISSDKSKVIEITSVDGNIQFHKGYYNQLSETYIIDISIPTTISEIKVNSIVVPVTGNSIDLDLDAVSTKSMLSTESFPTDNLLGLWHMDENTGSVSYDSHGDNNGNIIGAEWTPGISESCLNFDGNTGGLIIPSNPNLNIDNDEISLSFWFKMNEVGNSGCFMFHNTKYIVRMDNHGKVTFAIYNPTWNSITIPWSDRIIDTDWHNVTAIYNGSDMKLYIDNVLFVSKETTGNLNTSSSDLYIGNQSSTNFFNGLVDEAALYDRALSVSEINTIYSTIPNPDTGGESLVSWWPMDESSGNQVPDSQGQNDGVLAGGTWVTGVVGNCLSFNGESNYVDISNDETLNFSNSLSIMAWAKTRDYKEAKIAQKGDWDGHGIGGSKWNGWKGHIKIAGGSSKSIEWTNGRPMLDEWYHIAITYDGSTLKMYVNGQLNNSSSVSGNLHVNSRNASIGSDNGGQKFFNGLIDEVKFFNTALTSTEIQAVYNDQSVSSDTDGDGISDDDDDFPNDPGRAFLNYFPSTGFGSLAFEDLWPGTGDYDFNDLVVDYRFEIITNASNKVSDVISKTAVRAIGAGFNNGLGFQFSNDIIQSSDLLVTGYSLEHEVVTLNENGLEANQSKPTIIIFDNAKNIIQSTGFGVNVEQSSPYVEPDTVFVNITFTPDVYEISDLDLESFNPFLIIDGIRGKEVHLSDFPPTDLADFDLFGTADDNSEPGSGRYYKSAKNLPWAINITESFDYSIEKSQIISGYNHFAEWAESSGQIYQDWYKDNSGYRNDENIYQVPSVK